MQLADPFGRRISYLRVSVTDRCDFRCSYCMPERMQFLPRAEVLTLEELNRLASAFVRRGVTKLRITGGEPLVRTNVMSLMKWLSRHLGNGLNELTLTTNGSQLAKHAEALVDCGVKRINVSLDTLDPDLFRTITRRGDLAQVLGGIAAAKEAGLKVKINMVALAGLNEGEFASMVDWCGAEGHDLTLIETMPMGEIAEDRADRFLPLSRVRAELEARYTLSPLAERTGGPARYWQVGETGGRIGFITPLSHNFCDDCNRVRLTATGQLYMCLGQEDSADLRALVRAHDDDVALDAGIAEAISRKPKGHDFRIARSAAPATPRHMSVTGG